jgi:NADH:ubiquinone oxidoreductase subunit F (NADH-binding)
MPFQQGVRRRPTLVNNVETLAHLALIARHGARWFRELGTPGQPGSALVTLSGSVAHPEVYEIEHGASLSSLIAAGGGSTARVRVALLGGYTGAWVAGELLSGVALSGEHLVAHGASLGAGVVLLLSEGALHCFAAGARWTAIVPWRIVTARPRVQPVDARELRGNRQGAETQLMRTLYSPPSC